MGDKQKFLLFLGGISVIMLSTNMWRYGSITVWTAASVNFFVTISLVCILTENG